MSDYDIRLMELSDVKHVAMNVRQADKDELWASSNSTPYDAIFNSFLVSRDTTFTGTADGVPVCIFGVRPPSLINDVAVPWMIATSDLKFHSMAFLRKSRKMVDMLSDTFPVMENYVDERNVIAVKWLQWVGFDIYHPEPHGVENMPFHRFDRR